MDNVGTLREKCDLNAFPVTMIILETTMITPNKPAALDVQATRLRPVSDM
jgi:hypothetical protein